MTAIQAWAAPGAGAPLELVQLQLGELGADEVEVEVEHCGLCSADDALWRNVSGGTRYPFVPGHEVVGRVVAAGAGVPSARIGQRVGVGWLNGSCMHCDICLGGTQHLCSHRHRTVVDQPGGFASRVRSHAAWAIPLPEGIDAASAGPFFCAGIAVFRPLADLQVLPTWRVGVAGVGGLGHLSVKFLRAWGCEVTAFTSRELKMRDALLLGASTVVTDLESAAAKSLKGKLDLLLVTSRVADTDRLLQMLAPRGRVHVLATMSEPLSIPSGLLVGGDLSIGGSMVGSPADCAQMLRFAARHGIAPEVEHMPMSRVNEAFERFASGDLRYRLVLDADFR